MAYNISPNDDTHVVIVSESGSYINTANRFPVDAKIVGGVTGLTGSIKWESSYDDINLNTTNYTTFFEKSEKGALYGVIFKPDADTMSFLVEIDGVTILEIHLKSQLKDVFGIGPSNDPPVAPWIIEYGTNKFRFTPPEPILFNSSVKLRLKSDTTNKNLDAYCVTWRSA